MGLIAFPRTWTVKPGPGARVDSGHPLSWGLEAFWLMNEGGGLSIRNLISGKYAGTMLSTLVQWEAAKSGIGVRGNSTVAASVGISFANLAVGGSAAWTVELWLKASAFTASYETLITQNGDIGLYAMSSGKLNFYTGSDHLGSTVMSAGAWYHTCLSVSAAGAWTIYLHGVPDASGTGLTGAANLNSMFCDSFSEKFNGWIDYVRVWKGRALTANEVRSLYVSPFAMVRPPRQFQFAIPQAAVASFKPAWARNSNVIMQGGAA